MHDISMNGTRRRTNPIRVALLKTSTSDSSDTSNQAEVGAGTGMHLPRPAKGLEDD